MDKEARQDTRGKTARKGEDEPAAARGRAVINPPNPYPTGTCTNYHITLTTLCQARPPRASLHRKTPSAHAARALGVGERDVEGEQSVQHPTVSSARPSLVAAHGMWRSGLQESRYGCPAVSPL